MALLHGQRQIVAADPFRTEILGNFQLDYKTNPIKCDGYPWYARMFMKPDPLKVAVRLAFVQCINIVIEPERSRRRINKVEVEFIPASGLECLPFRSSKSERSGNLPRIHRLIALMHLPKHALKKHVGRIFLNLILRALASKLPWP